MQAGRLQFRTWIDLRFGGSQVKAAQFFGWHESVISQYLSGDRVPATVNAVKIEELAGIPVRAWLLSADDKPEPVAVGAGAKAKTSRGANGIRRK